MLGSLIHMDASDMVRIRAGGSDGIDIVFTDNCIGHIPKRVNSAGIAPEHLTGIAEEIIRYSKIFACAFYTDVVLLFVAELAFIAPLVADINMLGMSYQNGGAGQIINDVAVHYGVSDIVD